LHFKKAKKNISNVLKLLPKIKIYLIDLIKKSIIFIKVFNGKLLF
jgi:hypothetical protein